MKLSAGWAGLLALAFGASDGSAQWVHADDVTRKVEAWRSTWNVPGAAVGVIRGDEVLLLEGFGVSRLGTDAPVDAETLFELGSATKTFAATTAAIAVEEGLLEWQTPLQHILPGFRLRDPMLQQRLTLLDALTHRSGIGRNDVLWLSGASPEEVLRGLQHIEPAAGFRETFAYSNVMYMLAGAAVAAVYGRPWEQVVAERVFTPLGMTRSRFGAVDGLQNVAWPHVQLGDTVLPARTPRTHVGAAGAVLSSAAELITWMRYQLRAEGQVEALRAARVPLPLAAFGPQYARATHLAYGAGWFVADYAGSLLVDHIGGHGGMVALITLLPNEDIGVVVLANHGDNLLPIAVTNHVLDLLLGLDERPWNDDLHAWWDGVRAARKAAALAPGGERRASAPPSLPLRDYEGSYTSPVYGETHLEAGPIGLVLRHGRNLVGDLLHWHHDTFRITWQDPFVRAILGPGFAKFDLDMAGRPARLTWTGFQGERIESARAEGRVVARD
jgi:CubicO group peptidase (beta-lactamase class C family)